MHSKAVCLFALLIKTQQETSMNEPKLMSVAETARTLGVTESTIRCSLHRNQFPIQPRRIGARIFFARDDIYEWLENSKPKKIGRPRAAI